MNPFKTLVAAACFTVSAFAQFSTPVRDVDNAARNAVAFTITCTNNGFCATPYTIPAGFRLVITQIGVSGSSTPVNPGVSFILSFSLNGTYAVHAFHAAPFMGFPTSAAGSTNTLIFADVLNPTFSKYTNSIGPASGYAYIAGYLVKM